MLFPFLWVMEPVTSGWQWWRSHFGSEFCVACRPRRPRRRLRAKSNFLINSRCIDDGSAGGGNFALPYRHRAKQLRF
jgi:hypothetical protein